MEPRFETLTTVLGLRSDERSGISLRGRELGRVVPVVDRFGLTPLESWGAWRDRRRVGLVCKALIIAAELFCS